ncbi:signal peptidase I, partial [Patescibacteria group bacterium]|nr:signal peptidase I [Patescibacteria group bacterium]
SGKPMWWLILAPIPFVNIIMAIIIWMALAEKMGKPSWWGILMIVPFVNFIVPGYLAFSSKK